jgi:hypothetical protein
MTDPDHAEKLAQLARDRGVSLADMVRIANPKPSGRWAQQAIDRQEAQATTQHHHNHAQAKREISEREQGRMLPKAGHWFGAVPNPTEPPLGYSVDALEPADPIVAARELAAAEKAAESDQAQSQSAAQGPTSDPCVGPEGPALVDRPLSTSSAGPSLSPQPFRRRI